MPLSVVVTSQIIESEQFEDWDTACGQAVRESLNGAGLVRVVDTNGLEYSVAAWPKEKKP